MGGKSTTAKPTQPIKGQSKSQSRSDLLDKVKISNPISSKTEEFSSSNSNPLVTFASSTARSFCLEAYNMESNIDLDYILNIETDERVSVTHKQAIKIFSLISEQVQGKKLSALDLNQISAQFEFKGYINIAEISGVLVEILPKRNYSVGTILRVYRHVHKVLDRNRIESAVIVKILKVCNVKKTNELIGVDEIAYILGRIVKITVVGVE